MQEYHPSFHVVSPPMGQHKSPEAEASHLSPLLPETLHDCVQHARFTAFCLIHMNCTHSSLPSREQQLWGPPLFYISLFVTSAPSGWLKGDETPSVSVSPLLMDTTKDTGSSFEEQDMDNTFQQAQEPESHPPGGGDNSQTKLSGCHFQDALSLRGYQSRISRNTSCTVQILTCFKSESHSRDLCTFLCYLFSGDFLFLTKIINKSFYGSCCIFRKVKMCFQQ